MPLKRKFSEFSGENFSRTKSSWIKVKKWNGHKIWDFLMNILYISWKLGKDKSPTAKGGKIDNRMRGAIYTNLVNKMLR